MKRFLLLLLGVVLILILVGIWAYMLLTGSPDNTDRFAEFGFGETDDHVTATSTPVVEDTPEPTTDPTSDQLRQLTTKPVIGFVEVMRASTSTANPTVRYVEAGTDICMRLILSPMPRRECLPQLFHSVRLPRLPPTVAMS